MEQAAHFLRDLVVVYGVGTLVVFLFHRIRQSPVIGFLATGVIVGPAGLGWVAEAETVHVLAEIGVMLLLFSLGLEFSLQKVLKMRHVVFATGGLQVAATAGATVLAATALGMPLPTGVVLGFVMALSSTAIVLKLLMERNELDAIHGRVSLGVLIFQDLCVVPMMILVPLLAQPRFQWAPMLWALGKAVLVILATLLLARRLFPPLLDRIVQTRSKELFVVGSLFILLGTAWALSLVGFSLALGAFLAGLILSESAFSHQIFADIRPLRDGLNSLFFISIGMLVDPFFFASNALLILAIIAAVLAGKSLIVGLAVLASRFPLRTALLTGLSMAQIGEFSFILLETANRSGVLAQHWYQILISLAVASMFLTPALFWLARRLSSWRGLQTLAKPLGRARELKDLDRGAQRLSDHVIVCGYGGSGRNLTLALKLNEIPYLVLELNAQTLKAARNEDEPIYFGDCTDLEILEHAGIHRARAMVVAISDPFAEQRAVAQARRLHPEMHLLVRTKALGEIDALYKAGANEVVSQEFEAALELVTRLMRLYQFPRELVREQINAIRRERYGLFRDATVPRLRLSEQLDVFSETLLVQPESELAGQSIAGSRLRQRSGALILGIVRDSQSINNPSPDEKLQSGDRVVLIGTKNQLKRAVQLLAPESSNFELRTSNS